MTEKDLKLVYMGTPEFAVAPLKALISNDYNVKAIVTVPDKPAGRGQHLQSSPVKIYAQTTGLPLLQPFSMKEPQFIEQLKSLAPDVILVVAFRLLPPEVWKIASIGTINLHASLLPNYRGAAPIQHAIMNGETITGLTTFFIDEGIDQGKIILQQAVPIHPNETAGSLHDRMMQLGAELILKTLHIITTSNFQPKDQNNLMEENIVLHYAKKITRQDCKIYWHNPVQKIFNQIRALNPSPGAFTILQSPNGNNFILKVFYANPLSDHHHSKAPGSLITDGKSFVKVVCADGFLELTEVQLSGKKRMDIVSFLRGFSLDAHWTMR